MTIQRTVGAWLSVFTSCVIVNHWIQGQLSEFDWLYLGFLLPLVMSAFFDAQVMKLFQVVVILLAGGVMVLTDDYSRPFGFIIMAFSMLFSFTYGFLATKTRTKLAAFGAVYLVLFTVGLGKVGSSVMWVFMGGLWLNFKHLIEKARKAEELERMAMKQELLASETLLRQTVDAGMVLIQEIKSKEHPNGTQE